MLKNKLWLIHLPTILIATAAFWITYLGEEGKLSNAFLRETIFPKLRRVTTLHTDIKFMVRGPEAPKNKIVIVEIDGPSIETIGRWPWHRDASAALIHKVVESGAKAVGLDIVFSEEDRRVSKELGEILKSQNLGAVVEQFETDRALTEVLKQDNDKVVLGWATDNACQPSYSTAEDCPIAHPDAIATHPEGFQKFAYQGYHLPQAFDPTKTPVMSFATFLSNLQAYNLPAKYAGYFNTFKDPDGVIRRTSLLMFANKVPYPSLALQMARVGLGEELQVDIDPDNGVKSVMLKKSGREIPVSALGVMQINFRGGAHSFNYVSAMDVLSDSDTLKDELNRKLAGASKKDVLKDAYVFIGLTALGTHDIMAFPYDSLTPGVEGHAYILDNLLSGDPLVSGDKHKAALWITLLMIIGAFFFAFEVQRLEAVPALLFFLIVAIGFGFVDLKLLFANNINANTSFLFLEFTLLFVTTIAVKYVLEERNKKFIKSAFSKYVSPAIVDSIMKDPTKLSLGGEKKELTILFSDIRSFTTFSEKMDAKALAGFLNDYLGIMTKIVFKNNGTLDKYIGDAVMAFWGAPLDQPAHAANACIASIEMMKALGENKERYKTQFGIDVDIGVGINSGIVNVGNMGSSDNFEYTVIGDHVNLASRLEGLTKAYGASIVTSRFTFDCIQAANGTMPPHRVLDFVKVKGKKKAVELIEILFKELDRVALDEFQKGRELYTAQKWDEAIQCFEKSNQILKEKLGKEDGPSLEFIQRCQDFKTTPPEEGWDGSWEMHSK